MDKILITNIQRFSIHDGPGIRQYFLKVVVSDVHGVQIRKI